MLSPKQVNEDFIASINSFLSQLIFYSTAVVSSIGILTNILNIIICSNERIRRQTMGFFNILMSLFNVLSLVAIQVIYLPPSIAKQDLTLLSDYSCKLIYYFGRICFQMSAWLSVFATLERIACISGNKIFRFITDRIKLSLILLGLFTLILVLNVPSLFFNLSSISETVYETNQTIIYKSCISTSLIILIRNIEISIIRVYIPTILQTVLSFVLMYCLKNNKAKLNASLYFRNEYRFASLLIILNIVYVVTEIPYMVLTIYFGILGKTPDFPINFNSTHSLAIATLIYFCTFILSTYMFCSLFFLNIILNKKIKRQVIFYFCNPVATQSVQRMAIQSE